MKHLLEVDTWSSTQLKQILHLAQALKLEWQSGGNRPVLAGKLLGMVFQKPSLRTRVSFEVAMKHLGGDALYLSPQEIGLGTRESVADVARVLSGYVQGIMARVHDHAHVEELARWASVPVINGLSDAAHPCQALADILTIAEVFGDLRGLKVAYIGDGNNVAASLLLACAQFSLNFSIATPSGYELPARVIQKARVLNDQIEISQSHDVRAAAQGAHVLYTDTWISMGQEAEAQQRRAAFKGYQINEQLLSLAQRQCIVLHCLPAHRGEEITDAVADGPQSAIFQQAENRLHAQKAILVQLLAH